MDAFTDDAFRGNPAAVVLLDRAADPAWMRSVAAEMNQSETAFVVDAPAGEPKPLRWFTPTTEVELCGHATLASAHVLGGDQRFDTLSGELTCTNADGVSTMDFPADVPELIEPPARVVSALPGISVRHVAQGASKLLIQWNPRTSRGGSEQRMVWRSAASSTRAGTDSFVPSTVRSSR